MKTSTAVLGNSFNITAGSNASLMTLLISTSLLDGAGFFLSPTENGAMWYLQRKIPVSVSDMCFGCTSLGPYTPTRILLSPNSMYAEPLAFFKTPALMVTFRVSLTFLPSQRIPFSSNNTISVSLPPIFIHFLIPTFHLLDQLNLQRVLVLRSIQLLVSPLIIHLDLQRRQQVIHFDQ